MERLHAVVRGVVQGVGFRAWTCKTANSLSVKGWVRNLPDGSVELTAEGDRATLDELVRSLHAGPRYAKVTEVVSSFAPAQGDLGDFRTVR